MSVVAARGARIAVLAADWSISRTISDGTVPVQPQARQGAGPRGARRPAGPQRRRHSPPLAAFRLASTHAFPPPARPAARNLPDDIREREVEDLFSKVS